MPVAGVGEATLGPPAVSTVHLTATEFPPPYNTTGAPRPVTHSTYRQPATNATPVASLGVPKYTFFPTPPGKKSLASYLRRGPTEEPQRLTPTPAPGMPHPDYDRACASAEMLRPVAVDSGFHPVQRVEDGDPANASNAVGFVPATRPTDPPLAELPGTPGMPGMPGAPNMNETEATRVVAPPPKPERLDAPKAETGKAANDAKSGGTLPPPRMVKQPAPPKPMPGYPELPNPTVTNPPAAPREGSKRALSAYIIEPPDVLQIDLSPAIGDAKNFPIRGTHLVRPDGTVGLGPLGSVFVAGMTIDQAKYRIGERLSQTYYDPKKKDYPELFKTLLQGLKVDVTAYNSKFYYVIADGGGYGEQVYRILCTGNETILDAIAQVEGLPRVASKSKIWIARSTPEDGQQPNILPVDWCAVTQLGSRWTNYQIYPGDRIYVNSDVRIRVDSHLAKIISPIERLFGITLLGSTTVNSIRNGGRQGGNNNTGF